ncbi:hypothetical protein ACFYXQ_15990 [Nocardia jiangxiensis]|uniref:Uncharacterized protein n=1 Tax=Nocardia jiangxiensis TaxID=282685 RepID=A0ABW6S285_9NOCA
MTAAGQNAAVIGGRRLGLLAIAEMGGDLSRLPIIDPSGGDPLEIATVLADGVPVVVLDPGTRHVTVPAARARVLAQRYRSQRGVLICTKQISGFRPDLTIRSHVTAYIGLGPGIGRVQQMKFGIEISDRYTPTRRTELLLAGVDSAEHTAWTRASAAEAEAAQRWTHAG